jgi:hypothetical protein
MNLEESSNVSIVKTSGEREEFSEYKLRKSLKKAKASSRIMDEIVELIKSQLCEGMTTKEIYEKAFEMLRAKEGGHAARYKLKNAIMELGPTGYPFEKFVAELLERKGYKTEVGVFVEGFCVTHEVDVLAKQNSRNIYIECKYHNRPGIKSDVKITLYVQARYEDILKKIADKNEEEHEIWLVTNTTPTQDAIQYAECMNLKTIAWSYPDKDNLQNMIEESGLHPITCLSTLSSKQKQRLLEEGIVICSDLLKNKSVLKRIGVTEEYLPIVMDEVSKLCENE